MILFKPEAVSYFCLLPPFRVITNKHSVPLFHRDQMDSVFLRDVSQKITH